jgi:hypothetical protein
VAPNCSAYQPQVELAVSCGQGGTGRPPLSLLPPFFFFLPRTGRKCPPICRGRRSRTGCVGSTWWLHVPRRLQSQGGCGWGVGVQGSDRLRHPTCQPRVGRSKDVVALPGGFHGGGAAQLGHGVTRWRWCGFASGLGEVKDAQDALVDSSRPPDSCGFMKEKEPLAHTGAPITGPTSSLGASWKRAQSAHCHFLCRRS